jgi:hypothetical protein
MSKDSDTGYLVETTQQANRIQSNSNPYLKFKKIIKKNKNRTIIQSMRLFLPKKHEDKKSLILHTVSLEDKHHISEYFVY